MAFHVLLIPVTGLLEVFHVEHDINVQGTLQARGAQGWFMAMDLHLSGNDLGRVAWFHNDLAPINTRAREAVVMVCGVHVEFHGPVMLLEVEQTKINQIVSTLSSAPH